MTIADALQSLNTYPIADNYVEKVCIERELTCTEEYTKSIGDSQSFELASADMYFYLSNHPSIVEQEAGINNALAIKENMLEIALTIYGKYGDPKATARSYGFRGESFN